MDPDLRIERKLAIGTPFEDWTSSMHYYDKAGWIYVVGSTRRSGEWHPFLIVVDRELSEVITNIYLPLTVKESKEKPLCGIYVDSPGVYMTVRPVYIMKLNHYAEICDVAVVTLAGKESVIWGFDARGSTLFTSHGTLLCKIQDLGQSLKLKWALRSKSPTFGRLRVYGNRVYSAQGVKDKASILVSSVYDEGSMGVFEWGKIIHIRDETCKSVEVGPNGMYVGREGLYIACGLCKDRRVLVLKMTREGDIAWARMIDFKRGKASIYGIHVSSGKVFVVGKRDSDGVLIIMDESRGDLIKTVAFPYSGLTDVTYQDKHLLIAGVTWNLSVVDDMFDISAEAYPVEVSVEDVKMQITPTTAASLKHLDSVKQRQDCTSERPSLRSWQTGDNDVLLLRILLNSS